MATTDSHAQPAKASKETLWAILVSLAISVVLAGFVAGNPFSALRAAYMDVSHKAPADAGTPIKDAAPAPK